jgi:hypothetical protein
MAGCVSRHASLSTWKGRLARVDKSAALPADWKAALHAETGAESTSLRRLPAPTIAKLPCESNHAPGCAATSGASAATWPTGAVEVAAGPVALHDQLQHKKHSLAAGSARVATKLQAFATEDARECSLPLAPTRPLYRTSSNGKTRADEPI